ncbi:tetratricopeptide repeat protein [Sphingomonas sp. 1P06PA]|uniref:YbgF trimerization domain-containing protein n=1 Tax=Sphingomonas sp. 1P06PA TaxID=554121 RepID=UPI0039A6CFED
MMKPTLLVALLIGAASPGFAQSSAPGIGNRVDRLEKEMRAVQRKVFPGGQPYLEPEISAPAPQQVPGGVPASAPLADLTARVSSLEQELQRMTGQIEQDRFKLRQLEEQLAKLRGDTGSRLDALERGGSFAPAAGETPPPVIDSGPPPRASTRPPAEVEPVVEPSTPAASADPGEDAYLAGYRAWNTKDYAGAEAALKTMLAKYPQHKRASYAQNLLGRTYLDNGKPAAAAVAFHANYTKNPRGDRAPDSLYYLGQALMRLPTPQATKACEAYDALTREYGEKISQSLRDNVAKARINAKCSG